MITSLLDCLKQGFYLEARSNTPTQFMTNQNLRGSGTCCSECFIPHSVGTKLLWLQRTLQGSDGRSEPCQQSPAGRFVRKLITGFVWCKLQCRDASRLWPLRLELGSKFKAWPPAPFAAAGHRVVGLGGPCAFRRRAPDVSSGLRIFGSPALDTQASWSLPVIPGHFPARSVAAAKPLNGKC